MFDFDGTLVDTMEFHYLSWFEVFQEKGLQLSRQEFFINEGASLRDFVKTLFLRDQGVRLSDLEFEAIWAAKELKFKLRYQFNPYPGGWDLLESLRSRKISMALVTAGHQKRLRETTPPEFLDFFSAQVTGDLSLKGKPHPEPYLKAAELLGQDIRRCIAIENAPLGIRSAKAAGAYCIGLATTLDPADLVEADEVLSSLSFGFQSLVLRQLLEGSEL